jgi:hypothetical protein
MTGAVGPRVLSAVGVRGDREARHLDDALRGFYRDGWRRFLGSTGLHVAGWLLGALEALIILRSHDALLGLRMLECPRDEIAEATGQRQDGDRPANGRLRSRAQGPVASHADQEGEVAVVSGRPATQARQVLEEVELGIVPTAQEQPLQSQGPIARAPDPIPALRRSRSRAGDDRRARSSVARTTAWSRLV